MAPQQQHRWAVNTGLMRRKRVRVILGLRPGEPARVLGWFLREAGTAAPGAWPSSVAAPHALLCTPTLPGLWSPGIWRDSGNPQSCTTVGIAAGDVPRLGGIYPLLGRLQRDLQALASSVKGWSRASHLNIITGHLDPDSASRSLI